VLANNKMHPPENFVCTMIAAYCMGLGKQDVTADARYTDAGMVGGLGLKYLARRHLGMEMQTWQEVKDKPDDQEEYNAKDSVATYLLWEKWKPELPKHFWDIDMPLLPVLMAIEDRGIAIDPDKLNDFEATLAKALKNIDLPFNPFSTKQLQDYIYSDLGIEPYKFTDKGHPSVDQEVLEAIDDPVIRKVLEYKGLYKERGTYVQNYIERMTLDGRIHPEFKQCSTVTGRLSSAKPNLQNVPKTEIRALFIAPSGKKLIRVDYSQLELRVFAALTQEPEMLRAFAEGRNIHQETANITGLTYDQAKTLDFLMLFGGGAWKISQEFKMPIDKAKACLARYFDKFKGIQPYFEQTIEEVSRTKKVYNWFGRVRRMDALYAEDWRVRKQGEREAINTPIQGTAAEIVKIAMIDLHKKHKAPILLQVHDELVFEVPPTELAHLARLVSEEMSGVMRLNVPLKVDLKSGGNWADCQQWN